MNEVVFSKNSSKFLKKLKDKALKQLLKDSILNISRDYTIGELKKGDLAGIYCYDVFYNKTNYEIAYKIVDNNTLFIFIIMIGTRENFYNELKRYMD